MTKNVKLICYILAAYLLGFVLNKFGFPYLLYLAGIIIFFLPGYLIALGIGQLFTDQQCTEKTFLWTFLSSVFITPTVVLGVSAIFDKYGDATITIASLAGLLTVAGIINFVLSKIKKTPLTFPSTINIFQKKQFIYIIVAIIAIFVIHFILYPFVPESDPYYYLNKVRELFVNHQMPAGENRPLFISFSWIIATLSHIPTYWTYKLMIPLFGLMFPIVTYLSIRKKTTNKVLITIATTFFLSFPIITEELLIPRPQSIFLVTLPIFLYLVSEYSNIKAKSSIYLLSVLFIFSLLGTKYHQFFLFDILLVAAGILKYFWSEIRLKPGRSLGIFALLMIAIYPYAEKSGAISMAKGFSSVFSKYLLHPHFDLWFIDSYKNVDNIQMGWNGSNSLFYYGYNLGLGLLAVIIALFFIKKRAKITSRESWAYWLCIIFFFAIAEVFPRLGLAYFPDRAWLFLSVGLALLMPMYIVRLESIKKSHLIVIGSGVIISILLGFALTYFKQGWTSKNEYQAAQYLQENTPTNSLIISQQGNSPMISYFAERTHLIPDSNFFLDATGKSRAKYIEQVMSTPDKAATAQSLHEKEATLDNIVKAIFSVKRNNEYDQLSAQAIFVLKSAKVDLDKAYTGNYSKSTDVAPIYILYSYDKFDGLYGSRQWWRTNNFYGATNLTGCMPGLPSSICLIRVN